VNFAHLYWTSGITINWHIIYGPGDVKHRSSISPRSVAKGNLRLTFFNAAYLAEKYSIVPSTITARQSEAVLDVALLHHFANSIQTLRFNFTARHCKDCNSGRCGQFISLFKDTSLRVVCVVWINRLPDQILSQTAVHWGAMQVRCVVLATLSIRLDVGFAILGLVNGQRCDCHD
jgi:ABC-type amino acid transport system permease subunit